MDSIPNEVLREFLSHLNVKQKFALARVSKIFNFLAHSFPFRLFNVRTQSPFYKRKYLTTSIHSLDKPWYSYVKETDDPRQQKFLDNQILFVYGLPEWIPSEI